VYSYAVKSIVDLNKTEGAYLNALFWVRRLRLFALFPKFLVHRSLSVVCSSSIILRPVNQRKGGSRG